MCTQVSLLSVREWWINNTASNLENFPRYLSNRRNWRTIISDCITRVKSTSLCRSKDRCNASDILAYSFVSLTARNGSLRKVRACYPRNLGNHEIWLPVYSWSTKIELGFVLYWISGEAQGESHIERLCQSLTHRWISLLGIRFATSRRINPIT